jgi:hypothetical protein
MFKISKSMLTYYYIILINGVVVINKSKGIVLAGLLTIVGNTAIADELNSMSPENFNTATQTVTVESTAEKNAIDEFLKNNPPEEKRKIKVEPELNTDINLNHNNVLFYLKPINSDKLVSFDEVYESKKSVGAYRTFNSADSDFTNLSVLSVNTHGHHDVVTDITGKSIKDTLDDYDLDSSGYSKLMKFEYSDAKKTSFHKPTLDNGVDYNHINLATQEIKSIQFDMWDMNTEMDKESMDMVPYMVYLHETAHTHDHQEKFYRDLFNGVGGNLEFSDDPEKNKKLLKLEALGGENYADAFALIMSAKFALYEHGKDENGQYKGVTEKASKIIAESGDAWADYRKKTMGEKQDKLDVHLTFLTVKTTNDFIKKNKDVLCSLTEGDVQQISAMLANRTLNHKLTQKIRNKKGDKVGFAELHVDRISNNVGKEIQKMMTLGLDENNIPKADFSYNAKKHSKILQKKNVDTYSISPTR